MSNARRRRILIALTGGWSSRLLYKAVKYCIIDEYRPLLEFYYLRFAMDTKRSIVKILSDQPFYIPSVIAKTYRSVFRTCME